MCSHRTLVTGCFCVPISFLLRTYPSSSSACPVASCFFPRYDTCAAPILPGRGVSFTNDGATILKSIPIDNPAAKIIVDTSKTQDIEVGDGTTSVAVLSGELLREAEKLTMQKIHPQIIIRGYRKAVEAARASLLGMSKDHSDDPAAFRKVNMPRPLSTRTDSECFSSSSMVLRFRMFLPRRKFYFSLLNAFVVLLLVRFCLFVCVSSLSLFAWILCLCLCVFSCRI